MRSLYRLQSHKNTFSYSSSYLSYQNTQISMKKPCVFLSNSKIFIPFIRFFLKGMNFFFDFYKKANFFIPKMLIGIYWYEFTSTRGGFESRRHGDACSVGAPASQGHPLDDPHPFILILDWEYSTICRIMRRYAYEQINYNCN